MRMRWLISAICLCFLSTSAFGAPKEKPRKGNPSDQAPMNLNAEFVQDSDMAADGNLSEWGDNNIKFSTLIAGEYDYDWTGPKDLSGKVQAMFGANRIYFVISVQDQAVVNKLRQWKSDKVELWLAPEDSKGKALAKPRGLEMDIGPMVDGEQARVKWLSGKQEGARAVGFVGGEGYDFEIAVEYSALTKSPIVLDGAIRFCVLVRDWDQDDANEDEAAIGTCPINPKKPSSIQPAQMGRITLNLADAVWASMASSGAFANSNGDWNKQVVNIGGTDFPEIVAASDNTLIVAGYGLGTPDLSYSSVELVSTGAINAPKLEVKDMNGDKKPEIVMTRQEQCLNGGMTATRTYVFTYDGMLTLMSNYLTEQRDPDGKFVKNSYKFSKKGIVQTLEKGSAEGMDICQLNGDDDMIPVLMPEHHEKSRTVEVLY